MIFNNNQEIKGREMLYKKEYMRIKKCERIKKNMLTSIFSRRFTFVTLSVGLSFGLLLSPRSSQSDSQHTPPQTHDNPGGFRAGSKPFQNPFANVTSDSAAHPADPYFDDDDDDD